MPNHFKQALSNFSKFKAKNKTVLYFFSIGLLLTIFLFSFHRYQIKTRKIHTFNLLTEQHYTTLTNKLDIISEKLSIIYCHLKYKASNQAIESIAKKQPELSSLSIQNISIEYNPDKTKITDIHIHNTRQSSTQNNINSSNILEMSLNTTTKKQPLYCQLLQIDNKPYINIIQPFFKNTDQNKHNYSLVGINIQISKLLNLWNKKYPSKFYLFLDIHKKKNINAQSKILQTTSSDKYKQLQSSIYAIRPIQIGNKSFQLIYKPNQLFFKKHTRNLSWVILFCGLLLTSILTIYFLTAHKKSEKTKKIIQERSKALEQMNKELKQISNEQAVFFSNIPSWVYYKNKQLEYKIVNQSFANFLELPIEKIIGKRDEDFFLESELEFSKKCDEEIMNAGKPMTNIEEPITRKDGKMIWASTSRTPLFNDNGHIIGMVGIVTDISQHKKMELALRESENRFHRLSEAAHEAILIFDQDKNDQIIDINNRFLELFQYSSKDIFDLQPDSFFSPAFLSLFLNKAREKERDVFKVILIKKNKEEFPAECRIGRLPWKGREVTVITFRDISKRNEAIVALQESQERLYSFMDSATDSFVLLDNKLNIIEINKTALQEFEMKKSEVIGKNILDVSPAFLDQDRFNAVQSVLNKQDAFFKTLVKQPLINDRHIALKVFKVGDGLGIISSDITEQKKMEEKLTKYTETLKKKIKQRTDDLIQSEKMASLGLLVAGVAHEINNPLSYIKSSVEFMKQDLQLIEKSLANDKHALSIIHDLQEQMDTNIDGVNRLVEISQTLKRFAKSDSKKMSDANINQGIQDTLLILKNEIKNRIEIITDFADLPRYNCNIGQLNQVFMNMILNASQEMKKGRLWIKTKIKNNNIIISFKDEGKGISKEDQKNIFDPFFTTKELGTGLGLSISFRIINEHNGKILVDSVKDKGTTMIIQLPLEKQEDTD